MLSSQRITVERAFGMLMSSIEASYIQQKDAGVFMGWGDQYLYNKYVDEYDDNLVQIMYGNHLPTPATTRVVSDKKEELLQYIYDCGIRFDDRADRDFMYRQNGEHLYFECQ